MKFHGNYCGPYWSDGKVQQSVVGSIDAMDAFDDSCKVHDALYAIGADLDEADAGFIETNMWNGIKPTLAASAVFLQRTARALTKLSDKTMTKTNKNKTTNLRGSNNVQSTTKDKANAITKITSAPVGYATQIRGAAPQMSASGNTFRVAHRAYLGAVSGSTNFSVLQYFSNPGIAGTFPWLHRIARRYEEYRFRKLVFEFRSVCASSTAGVIMMSFDYDAADDPPTTKAAQAQTIPNIENNVWMSTKLEVPPTNTFKYVRSGTLGANLDIKTYDMGQLFLSTAYGTSASVVGELYVHYDVELRYPTDGPNTCARAVPTGSVTKATPIGDSLTFDTSTKASPFERRSATSIIITQPGEYLFTVTTGFSTMTAGAGGNPTLTGASTSAISVPYTVRLTGNSACIFAARVSVGDYIDFSTIFNDAGVTTVGSIEIRAAVADYDVMI